MKKILLACLVLSAPLMAQEKVLAFAGSTRADSYNKKLVQEAAKIAQQMGADVTLIDLKDYPMPFYDADLEKKGMPAGAKQFRDLMIQSDSVIISSPEYNHSIPGILKNALDWASRSEEGKSSKEAFKGKKFAIMSASPGKNGGARGLVHLREIIEDCGGVVLAEQVSVSNAEAAFSSSGISASLKEQLTQEIIPQSAKNLEFGPRQSPGDRRS